MRRRGERWSEAKLLSLYATVSPAHPVNASAPVLEASPYYLSGMPDSWEDLTRLPRLIPGVQLLAIVRNPVERAFSEFLMFSEPPFRPRTGGCVFGRNLTFEEVAGEEMDIHGPALMTDGRLKSACLRESAKFQPVLLYPNATSPYTGRLLGFGEYARHAEAWMRTLPPEQLMFVKTEDLEHKDRGGALVSEILAWAGLTDVPLRVRRSNTAACRGSHARGAFTPERAAAIEGGRASFLCLDPDGGAADRALSLD